jgi:flagellar hook-associated protein 1 FlgK
MSMFNVAVSGLNAAKQALTTTSHNIANANNPNYTRQEVVVTSVEGVSSGSGSVGRGVNVQNVRRLDNEFLTDRLNQLASQLSFSEARASRLNDLDRISSDADTSLEGAMQAFFQAAQDLSVRPSDETLKQNFLFAADEVSSRLNGLFGNAQTLATEVDVGITNSIDKVNTLSAQIAELNIQITDSTSFVGNLRIEPNDLIDQRDGLIRELSGEIELQINELGNGRVNINTTLGVPLVSEGKAFTLEVQAPKNGTGGLEIVRRLSIEKAEVVNGQPTGKSSTETITIPVPSREFGKARLGGLLQVRDGDLKDYVQGLTGIGQRISNEANAIQSAGGKQNLFSFDASSRALRVTNGFDLNDIAIQSDVNGNNLIRDMANLFTANGSGSNSIRQDYRNLTTRVANGAAAAETDIRAKEVIRDQVEADRSGFSGVNLDEEAANLLRYQQAYSASGKVIGISRDLFQELLDIAGR